MRLFEVKVTGVDTELMADRCWTAGAAGIWEVDNDLWRIGVEADDVGGFLSALEEFAPVDVTETEAVVLATRNVAVHGMELSVPPTVFGDGAHPTTRGCLAAIASVVGSGDSVLDVGCGTGVLAIPAAAAGASVTAIDIDPDAVESTLANAAANDVTVDASTTPLAEISGHFDVVVANITAGSIAPLLSDLARLTSIPGTLIVSGILDDQWADIESELRSLLAQHRDLSVSHTSVDGWVTGMFVLGAD